MYRQTLLVEEIPGAAKLGGRHREEREVIFTPAGERSEQVVGRPLSTLKQLILTKEDFDDIRNIQPLLLTPDRLRFYEIRFRGDEVMDQRDCWVLDVRPRQILQGQRLFEGLVWVDKGEFAITRMEGKAVPPIYTKDTENLFPRFVTIRKPVDGKHWFPIETFADDILPFRNGPLRIRMRIQYTDYKRFGAESRIVFEK